MTSPINYIDPKGHCHLPNINIENSIKLMRAIFSLTSKAVDTAGDFIKEAASA